MILKKIAFFTSTRAEYGLLRPVMQQVKSSSKLELITLVSGTHLSCKHGETWKEIVADGFVIDEKIPMPLQEDNASALTNAAASVLASMGVALERHKPDFLVLLGDRYEILSAALAAVLAKVPIIHIHGGETTEGALDESIRHAVTKLSHLHFPAAAEYGQRILQMGESAESVFVVGAPAMDNIAALEPMSIEQLQCDIGIKFEYPLLMVTYHPVTLDQDGGVSAMKALLAVLSGYKGSVVFTGVNADPGGENIRALISDFVRADPEKAVMVESLGAKRYLSMLHHVDCVVGNSSSGLLEAPAIGVPTVNIGNRQKGRLSAPSVINCDESELSIRTALETALGNAHRQLAKRKETPYGSPGAAKRMTEVIENYHLPSLAKHFQDA